MRNLNNDEQSKFLTSALIRAKKIKNEFEINLEKSDRQNIAEDFQTKILSILEHMYTNFPVNRNLLGDYFPRPYLAETRDHYTDRIKTFTIYKNKKRKIINHPQQVIDFLQTFYSLNEKHNFAISYISSKYKHETVNQFNEDSLTKLDAKIRSNNPEPIQTLPNGDVSVGPFHFGKGSNVEMENCAFFGANTMTIIKKLKLKQIKITGNKIIFNNGDEFKFNEWADNCINICEQSIKDFRKIQKET